MRGFAVEMNLDAAAAGRVTALWRRLADAGLTSEMPDMGARPHVSLAVFDEADPDRLAPALESFARDNAPARVQLASAGTFPTDEGVVFLAPVVTGGLLELHARFHGLLSELGVRSWEHYLPGRWVPHCTVAIFLPREKVPETLALASESDVFGPAELDELALIEFLPVREIHAFPFTGEGPDEP